MAIVIADDSFKKPAVPFKWEIRPGISKFQHPNDEPPPSLSSSLSSLSYRSTSSTSGSGAPSKELQAQWVQSMSLSSNTKSRLSSSLTRVKLFLGHNGCFPIPWSKWMKWRNERKLAKPQLKLKLELDPECINKDNTFYLEKLARWSMSSSWRASSSSLSSRIPRSSPDQPTFSNDDEAAQVRLFRSLLGILRRPKMIGMESKGREKKEINISVYVVNNNE